MQELRPGDGARLVCGGEGDRGGQSGGDFGRKTGAGEHAAGVVGAEGLGHDFVSQFAAARFKALARPQQRCGVGACREVFGQRAQAGHRGDHEVQVCGAGRAGQIRFDTQRIGKAGARQQRLVGAGAGAFVERCSVAAPQRDVVVLRVGNGQRGAPRAGAVNRDVQCGVGHRGFSAPRCRCAAHSRLRRRGGAPAASCL